MLLLKLGQDRCVYPHASSLAQRYMSDRSASHWVPFYVPSTGLLKPCACSDDLNERPFPLPRGTNPANLRRGLAESAPAEWPDAETICFARGQVLLALSQAPDAREGSIYPALPGAQIDSRGLRKLARAHIERASLSRRLTIGAAPDFKVAFSCGPAAPASLALLAASVSRRGLHPLDQLPAACCLAAPAAWPPAAWPPTSLLPALTRSLFEPRAWKAGGGSAPGHGHHRSRGGAAAAAVACDRRRRGDGRAAARVGASHEAMG